MTPGSSWRSASARPCETGPVRLKRAARLLETLPLVEKQRDGAPRNAGRQRRGRGAQRLDAESEFFEQGAAAQRQHAFASVRRCPPVGALRYTRLEFLGGEQARVAQTGDQFGAQPVEHPGEEPDRGVATWLPQGGGAQALDLGQVQPGLDWRGVADRTTQRGPSLVPVGVGDDQ